MRAKAWNNGSPHSSGAGCGVKVSVADRDRWFRTDWAAITLQIPGEGTAEILLSESFWRRCSELRSAALGRWLRSAGLAPWPKGQPPALTIEPVQGSLFRLHAD